VVEGVVGCVAIFNVVGMLECRTTDHPLRSPRRHSLPDDWRVDGRLDGMETFDDLIAAVKRFDRRSDDVLRALLSVSALHQTASEVIVAALMPLVLARCVGRRGRVDDFLAELAIVIGEERADGVLRSTTRRLANQLLDRAWGRVRLPLRRAHHPIAVDPLRLHRQLTAVEPDPADVAVDRVSLAAVEQYAMNCRLADPAVDRAWKTAVRLMDVDGRTERERQQLNYARRILRQSMIADDVA